MAFSISVNVVSYDDDRILQNWWAARVHKWMWSSCKLDIWAGFWGHPDSPQHEQGSPPRPLSQGSERALLRPGLHGPGRQAREARPARSQTGEGNAGGCPRRTRRRGRQRRGEAGKHARRGRGAGARAPSGYQKNTGNTKLYYFYNIFEVRRDLDPILSILGNFSDNNKLLSRTLVKDITQFNLLKYSFE